MSPRASILRTRFFVAVAATVLALPSPAWAGAWTVPKNRWYVEYFYRYFRSKKQFNSEGDSHRLPKVGLSEDIRNEWKLEYGVTDWFNLLASLPYISAHYRDDNTDLLRTGIGDMYLRTKFRLLNHPMGERGEPLVGSVQFSWKIAPYNRKRNPLNDGQFDFESRLMLSKSWVFSPYQATVPVQAQSQARDQGLSIQRLLATDPSDAASLTASSASRDTAMREAFLVAELYQRGQRLYDRGRYREAAQWLKAAVQTDPSNHTAQELLVANAVAAADAYEGAHLGYRTAAYERAPVLAALPADTGATKTEMRYAHIAFVNVEGAFTARRGAPANEFPIVLEAGFTPWKKLMLVGSVDSVISGKSTHEETEDFAKWGLRAIVNLWGDGFGNVFRESAGPTVNFEFGYNDVFAGRNTADALEVFGKIGVFF